VANGVRPVRPSPPQKPIDPKTIDPKKSTQKPIDPKTIDPKKSTQNRSTQKPIDPKKSTQNRSTQKNRPKNRSTQKNRPKKIDPKPIDPKPIDPKPIGCNIHYTSGIPVNRANTGEPGEHRSPLRAVLASPL
jgi:hypothetical protein